MAANRPVPVTEAEVMVTNVPMQLQAIGTVHAYSTVSVKSKIAGEIAQVGFREGDEVNAGALIFLIDPRPFQGALEQAQANLARDKALLVKAEADFRRAEELLKRAVISQSDFDADRASVDASRATILADEAAVGNARVQLEYCHIRSPIDGRVGALLVNQGNIVKDLDTVMVVINQLKPIYVDFAIPEQSLADVRRSMAAGKPRVDAGIPRQPGPRAVGELEMINNAVDTTTGTIICAPAFPTPTNFSGPASLWTRP
jgi:multidrug efflux system membrane fusion protein